MASKEKRRSVVSGGARRRWALTALLLAVLTIGLLGLDGWLPLDTGSQRTEARGTAEVAPLADYQPDHPYYPAERWQMAVQPEVVGWSSQKLQEAQKHATSLGTSAMVIIENGVIVDAWGDLSKRYQSRSMRKSYLSMLYGPAVAEGKINLSSTLEDLGIDDEPPLTPAERQATVFDLLTARSGVYHAANFESKSMRRKRPERGSHTPGSFWFYNNWDFNALGTIYEQAVGESIFSAFRRQIAEPLQMQHHEAEDTTYFKRKYSVHPAYRFRMSPLDLGRLGLLYLRKGSWKGQQIIPADWVELSTKAHVDIGRKGFYAGYGFMWWVGKDGFAAVGSKGQRIFVMPEHNVVIIHVVDADVKDRRVPSGKIRGLLRKIMAARPATRSDIEPPFQEMIRRAATPPQEGAIHGSPTQLSRSSSPLDARAM